MMADKEAALRYIAVFRLLGASIKLLLTFLSATCAASATYLSQRYEIKLKSRTNIRNKFSLIRLFMDGNFTIWHSLFDFLLYFVAKNMRLMKIQFRAEMYIHFNKDIGTRRSYP